MGGAGVNHLVGAGAFEECMDIDSVDLEILIGYWGVSGVALGRQIVIEGLKTLKDKTEILMEEGRE